MFQTTCRGAGEPQNITPVVVVSHGYPDPVGGAVDEGELDRIFAVASDLWGDRMSPGLLETAVREADESDVVLGQTPEQWSPLGRLPAASLGLLTQNDALVADLVGSSFRLHGQERLASGAVWLSLEENGVARAALGFGGEAFLVPVPAETEFVSVVADANTPWELEAELLMREALGSALDGTVERHLSWRLYVGGNTARNDGSTSERGRLFRIPLKGTRAAGLLVGRLVYSIPMSSDGRREDPFAAKRLMAAELTDRAVATSCPRIGLAIRPHSGLPGLAVAVHGTMSSAVTLARAIQDTVVPGVPVVRFEHDTWLPVASNAEELASEIRRLSCDRVLLVAHSRGGLVARHTAQILLRDGIATDVLTLGSPFGGTPIIEGVEKGSLGDRALLGGLRAMTGSVFVDAPTRLLGWLIKGDLPPGLAAMEIGSAYLRDTEPFTATAVHGLVGEVSGDGDIDSYGLAFLSGFSEQAFGGSPHDLVVGRTSGSCHVELPWAVSCDHFSYLLQPEFHQVLTMASVGLPRTYVPLESESPRPVE